MFALGEDEDDEEDLERDRVARKVRGFSDSEEEEEGLVGGGKRR